MDASRQVMRRIMLMTEAVVASDVTIHKIGDDDTAAFYFGIGHGDSDYMKQPMVTGYEDKDEYTDPLTHEIWVLKHGEIQRSHQLNMPQIEDDGVDVSDPEALQSYIDQQAEQGQELPTWSHNEVFGPDTDDYWKGHYEGDTGRLSVVNPGRFKLTGQLLGLLRSEFSPSEIHVFE